MAEMIVRLMPEYGVPLGLWGTSAPIAEVNYEFSVSDPFSISPSLKRRLKAWNDEWFDNYVDEPGLRTGWVDGFDRQAWLCEGDELSDELEEELGVEIERMYAEFLIPKAPLISAQKKHVEYHDMGMYTVVHSHD